MESSTPWPQVPGWEVRRELGRGGNSTVWLVADAEGSEAALKIPDHRVEAAAELLDIELRAVGELDHDHVVRPLGVVSTDRGPGLLSEYHPGGSLGALVRAAGPLPLGQVVTVLVPVAQALQALHERGVVHGDVSPGNILFTVMGRPAVSDLGSSRLLGGPGRRLGTPGFSAPELDQDGVAGPPDGDSPGLNPAADVYSLAAVGWFALTGRAPAATASRAPLPLIVPDIPLDVVELLEAGLEEDPARRPTAERFAMACYRWATPVPVDLYPAAGPDVAMELPTRRRESEGHDGGRRVRRQRGQRRRRGRRGWSVRRGWMLGGGVAATLGVAVTAGLYLAAPEPDPVQDPPARAAANVPAATTTPEAGEEAASSSPEPAATTGLGMEQVADVAESLGEARTEALTSLDRRQVAVYSLPDSPAFAEDVGLQEQLEAQGLRFEGLRLETAVTGAIEQADASTATVPVELTISPYRTVTSSGDTVAESPTPTVERFTVQLQRTTAGWRVREILP
ncbi:serine/threonine-protein kinase [Citricoccus sp. K5]|uniref:serine/threonine-protein kinase n=1 Tax=Citricoccus sp. K5 TaxID=2653135 RepID=UPI0012EF858C|nr:serine/threonine-protein kinase [Citricoccus sp. K5]VXB44886.1 Serine/threonine protein kinase [Citricoccus sp. K5]